MTFWTKSTHAFPCRVFSVLDADHELNIHIFPSPPPSPCCAPHLAKMTISASAAMHCNGKLNLHWAAIGVPPTRSLLLPAFSGQTWNFADCTIRWGKIFCWCIDGHLTSRCSLKKGARTTWMALGWHFVPGILFQSDLHQSITKVAGNK